MANRSHLQKTASDSDIRSKIITADEGVYYVMSPAGTGKTMCLAQRVLHASALKDSEGKAKYKPEKMLCITFTNNAEDEMRNRINAEAPSESATVFSKIFIGTIHKHCLKFLLEPRNHIGRFRILNESEIQHWLKNELSSGADGESSPLPAMEDILHCAALMRQKEEKHPDSVWIHYSLPDDAKSAETLYSLSQRYLKWKRENALFDLDDILIETYSRLSEVDAREHYRRYSSYEWIQVDEVQDLNPLQHGIIQLLIASENSTVVYFGDRRQAIFSFLGTDDDQLSKLKDYGKEGHVFELKTNFRSPDNLVRMFEHYAACNLADDTQSPSSQINKKISGLNVIECDSACSEARNIVSNLRNIANLKSLPYYRQQGNKRSAAVLVRTGEEADRFSRALNLQGIPHIKGSGGDYLAGDSIKTTISHFGVVSDDFCMYDWARILYKLGCGSSVALCRGIAESMLCNGLLPSDFLKYEDSSYLKEFLKACKGKYTIYFRNGEEIEFCSSDSEKSDIFRYDDNWTDALSGSQSLISIESQQQMEELASQHHFEQPLFSLSKIEMLIGQGGTSYSDDTNFKAIKARIQAIQTDSNKLIQKQDIYISHAGIQFVSKRLRLYYKPIYEHTQAIVSNTDNGGDYPKILASEFRYVYDKFGNRNVIPDSTFTPRNSKKTGRKYKSMSQRQAEMHDSHHFTAEEWKRLCEANAARSRIIADYFFKYLESILFIKYGSSSIPDMLQNSLNVIRQVKEMDFYGMPFARRIAIYVMTIHQAKGLSFTDVFIPDCSSSNYPKMIRNAKIEEDKRLLYVALTRSRSEITITYVRGKKSGLSPFIEPVLPYFSEHSVDEGSCETVWKKENRKRKEEEDEEL